MFRMSDCQLSVVVPCYNEQEVLAAAMAN